jgi:hypothetical protein
MLRTLDRGCNQAVQEFLMSGCLDRFCLRDSEFHQGRE